MINYKMIKINKKYSKINNLKINRSYKNALKKIQIS